MIVYTVNHKGERDKTLFLGESLKRLGNRFNLEMTPQGRKAMQEAIEANADLKAALERSSGKAP